MKNNMIFKWIVVEITQEELIKQKELIMENFDRIIASADKGDRIVPLSELFGHTFIESSSYNLVNDRSFIVKKGEL